MPQSYFQGVVFFMSSGLVEISQHGASALRRLSGLGFRV